VRERSGLADLKVKDVELCILPISATMILWLEQSSEERRTTSASACSAALVFESTAASTPDHLFSRNNPRSPFPRNPLPERQLVLGPVWH
jgi:hypothetical protein